MQALPSIIAPDLLTCRECFESEIKSKEPLGDLPIYLLFGLQHWAVYKGGLNLLSCESFDALFD